MYYTEDTINEAMLATNNLRAYLVNFKTPKECLEDFSRYKTIPYQQGVCVLNVILSYLKIPQFSRIISIVYHEDESPNSDCYPNIIYIETDKGNFRLKWDRYWTPDGTKIKLKDTIDTGDNELMIHAVANWIKQLMN